MSKTKEQQTQELPQEKPRYTFRTTLRDRAPSQGSPIFETRAQLIEYVDELLYSVSGQRFSLMNELNNMQTEALFPGEDQGKSVFDNKFTIPFYFINLILIHYGLELYEVR